MVTITVLDDPESYTVGWIAALPIERAAAVAMLDEKHAEPKGFTRHPTDTNVYTWGRMGEHNIAIASLAAGIYGLTSAATTASSLSSSLPSIRIGLLVGIGGGIPRPDEDRDIRLGDVVVSQPDGTTGGVCQYDLVKLKPGNLRERKGFLGMPPTVLLKALASIQADHEIEDSKIPEFLESMLKNNPKMAKKSKQNTGYVHQGFDSDRLFDASYEHVSGQDCHSCQAANEIEREPRDTTDPDIHYGIIASGNTLVKDATARDQIVADVGEDCICFEMEAAGLMNHFPCLVIRGVCDYADSHKNDRWQRYASATAAAYAKEFLAYVPAAEVRGSKRALEILQSVEQKVNATQQTALAVKQAVESVVSGNQRERIHSWLAPPDPSTNANQARKLRHEGTGGWLLETTEFQNWVAGEYRHLWLHGLAGCGKTIISSTILDYLTEEEDSRFVLSFFFDFSDATKQTFDGMLRSLASQLYHRDLDSAAHLDNAFRTHHDGKNKPTTKALFDVLRLILANQTGVFIVIDALDESTTGDEVRSWIKDMFSTPELAHVQLIYTSRPEAEFINEIPTLIGDECCIPLNKWAINGDIYSYVAARLVTDPGFNRKRLSEDLLERLRDKIGNGADGMFRWAACQLDSLSRCLTPMALKKELDRLPRDLTETYDRMLRNIPQEYQRSSIRLLQFVVHSTKPLTLEMAVEVVATEIEDDPPHFHPDGRVFSNNDILRHCPSLISVIDVKDWKGVKKELQLAHFSVKEYLLCRHEFNFSNSSNTITKTCLAYLNDIEGNRWRLAEEFPMAQYAAESWPYFAKAERTEVSNTVTTAIASFLQEARTLKRWIYLNETYDEPWLDTAEMIVNQGADVNSRGGACGTALQAASYFGHLQTVRLLLENQADVNAKGGNCGTALQAACSEGHLEIVRLLLENRADVNAEAGEFQTALQAASYNRNLEIIRLLLDQQADVNAKGGEHGTALQAVLEDEPLSTTRLIRHSPDDWSSDTVRTATYDRYLEIIQILLDNQADVNAPPGRHGTALELASHHGELNIVKILLEHGADIEIRGERYGDSLKAASAAGHEDIAFMLIDWGADVNSQYGIHANLLNAAAFGGSEKIVQLLINKNVNVNAEGGTYGNALQAASYSGHKKIVQILIDNGADVNAQGGTYGNALQAACYMRHENIVEMLVNSGAHVDSRGGKFDTALRGACCSRDEKIVKMLVDFGADIGTLISDFSDFLGKKHYTGFSTFWQILIDMGMDLNFDRDVLTVFLQHACYSDCNELIEELVRLGADINNPAGGLFGNPLLRACGLGDQDAVQLLIRLGADLNQVTTGHFSAIHCACMGRNESLVEMVLDWGADVNAKGFGSISALMLASTHGDTYIVQLLLDNGSDVTAADMTGTTALHAASLCGHYEVAALLCEKGADVMAVNMTGTTALHAASLGGHHEVAALLCEKGADVTAMDQTGMSPLHLASLFWRLDVAELLCEKGADVTIASLEGWTPLHVASTSGQEKLVELLSQEGIKAFREIGEEIAVEVSPPLIQPASPNGRLEVVKLLYEKGADIKAADAKGFTPLHRASTSGYVEVVSLFLGTHIIHPDLENTRYGRTALSYAAEQGREEVVELLTNAHTSACSKDNLDRTPLYHASNRGHHTIVTYLLRQDPSAVNLPDHYGSTSLLAAARKGHIEVAKSLLDAGAEMFPDSFGRTPLWWARRHGHTEMSQLLLENAKNNGSTPRLEVVPETITRAHDLFARTCDVCTFSIPAEDDYHRCSVCNYGDFDVCRNCFASSARCLQPLHELVYVDPSGGGKDNECDEVDEDGARDEESVDDEEDRHDQEFPGKP